MDWTKVSGELSSEIVRFVEDLFLQAGVAHTKFRVLGWNQPPAHSGIHRGIRGVTVRPHPDYPEDRVLLRVQPGDNDTRRELVVFVPKGKVQVTIRKIRALKVASGKKKSPSSAAVKTAATKSSAPALRLTHEEWGVAFQGLLDRMSSLQSELRGLLRAGIKAGIFKALATQDKK